MLIQSGWVRWAQIVALAICIGFGLAEYEVGSRVLLEVVGTVDGCVTGVVPIDDGLLAAVYGASGVRFFPDR